MSNKHIISAIIILYFICLAALFTGARHYVIEKDYMLYSEAINSLKSCFNGRDNIVTIVYSAEDVGYEQIQNKWTPNDSYYQLDEHVTTGRSDQISEEQYLWNKAYKDVYKKFELKPRYKHDRKYTGFLFRVLKTNGNDAITEYTLYPKYVGVKQPSGVDTYEGTPSIQDDISEALSFFTTNKKSIYYGDFVNNAINKWDIAQAVENEYYELWSYKINSELVDFTIQDSAMGGKGDSFLGISHQRKYYRPYDFKEMNKLGFNTYFENNYCRVYLEAKPIDALTVRYRFININGRHHPMLYDMERICFYGFLIITVLFGVIITSMIWIRQKQKNKNYKKFRNFVK